MWKVGRSSAALLGGALTSGPSASCVAATHDGGAAIAMAAPLGMEDFHTRAVGPFRQLCNANFAKRRSKSSRTFLKTMTNLTHVTRRRGPTVASRL